MKEFTEWCYHTRHWITFILWFGMILLIQTIVIYSVIMIRKIIQITKINQLKILYILTVILFIVAGIGAVVQNGVSIFCTAAKDQWYFLYLLTSNYLNGLSTLYLFYLFRLKYTFENTKFSLSSYTFGTCIFGFILQSLCIFGGTYLYIIGDLSTATNLAISFIVFNLLFNLLLVGIFTRKIYILGNAINASAPNNLRLSYVININFKSRSDKIKEQYTLKLLDPTIRYTICAFISTISSHLLSIIGRMPMILDIAGVIDLGLMGNQIMWNIGFLLLILDIATNLICLYLQFSIADKTYDKYCFKFHLCIRKVLVKRINLQNQNKNTYDNDSIPVHDKNKNSEQIHTIDLSPEKTETLSNSTHTEFISDEPANLQI